MIRLSQEFSSDLSQLAALRTLVAEACARAWGAREDDAAVRALQLALVEAATNVIRHAYQGETGQPLLLVIDAAADRVIATLYHQGRAFDPEAVAPPAFDGSRTGGFGIYLMKQLADEVSFFRDPDGRSGVRLAKNRTPMPGKE